MGRQRRRTAACSLALAGLLLTGVLATVSQAQDAVWRHGVSLIGPVKYPKGFKRFDYVNPDAPKGGSVRFGANGTFDTLNPVLPKGNRATGLNLSYETLMTPSYDEASTEYGLLAEELSYPEDFSSVTYRLRKEARWHDGKPITPEDVIWSFNIIKEIDVQRAFYYKHVKTATKTGEREITFKFDQTGNRELPQIVGQLTVLPQHWWEGSDAAGKKRDIRSSTLEPPLGSGPYKVGKVDPGRSIAYDLVEDYWGRDINVNVGSNNIGEIRYEYFRDNTAQFEAFKSGSLDWRNESTAKVWATQYEFPAIKKKQVVLNMYENSYRTSGVMVGFIPNMRRDKFKDVRLRQAMDLAFNFEELNRSIFYGQYERIDSYFYGSSLAAKGLPEGRELEILKGLKNPIPEEIFTEEFKNPSGATRGDDRKNRRSALRLLKAAGYEIKQGLAIDPKTGKPLIVELLLNGPTFEGIALRYLGSLKRIGITLKLRVVDSSQFIERVRNREFDMMYAGWGQSLSLGNEQLDYFGSDAANKPTSRNYGGIQNPAIDEIIQLILKAKDRDELVALSKAYDRILLWNRYIIPGWTLRASRTARWDKYSHPDPLPEFAVGFPNIWWYDQAKAEKIGR
ncbi:MAG: ABC transporter substrate-binding protein [Alphaproteobacteria bacterium]|nr:ABC transporter substrate-binding protein [Alphaproteobacteria bacterium]